MIIESVSWWVGGRWVGGLAFSGRLVGGWWVYETVGNPAFCLFLYLTGVHFRGELEHGGDVSQPEIKCPPIRTREIVGVSLSDVLYDP